MYLFTICQFVNKNLIAYHKKNYFLLLLFMIFSNLVQVSSFLSIIPFITYLLDPNSQNYLLKIIKNIHFINENSLVFILGSLSIIFLLFGSFISVTAIYFEKKFGYKLLTDTKFSIYSYFLNKKYQFYLDTDTSFLSSIILSDVERYGTNIVFCVYVRSRLLLNIMFILQKLVNWCMIPHKI